MQQQRARQRAQRREHAPDPALQWPRDGRAPQQTMGTISSRPAPHRPTRPAARPVRRPVLEPDPPADFADVDGLDDFDDDGAPPVRVEQRIEPRAPRPGGGGTAVAVREDVRVALDAPVRAPRKVSVPLRVSAPAPAEIALPDRAAQITLPEIAPRTGFRRKPLYDAAKRAMDLVIALGVLILGLPVWVTIAVLIKLGSHGPVFFRGTVVGKDCRAFTYFKFRSMRINGDDKAHRKFIERYVRENGGHEHEGEVVYKLMGDDRVTAIGRWIRKFSLDEIPQLINVVRGEMSIVGPRPPLDYEFEHYDETREGAPRGAAGHHGDAADLVRATRRRSRTSSAGHEVHPRAVAVDRHQADHPLVQSRAHRPLN